MAIPIARAMPVTVRATMEVRAVGVPMVPAIPMPPAPAFLMPVLPSQPTLPSSPTLLSEFSVIAEFPSAVAPIASVVVAVAVAPVAPPPLLAPLSESPVAPLIGPASPTEPLYRLTALLCRNCAHYFSVGKFFLSPFPLPRLDSVPDAGVAVSTNVAIVADVAVRVLCDSGIPVGRGAHCVRGSGCGCGSGGTTAVACPIVRVAGSAAYWTGVAYGASLPSYCPTL